MRLDHVLIRLRDTRIYVDFETKEVIREYLSKECEYEKIREVRLLEKLLGDDLTIADRNSQQLGTISQPL